VTSAPYRLEGQPESNAAAVRISGWARWRVLDAAGELVGLVVEDREWLGHTWGEPRYDAVHNPTDEEFGALWVSRGHPTPKAALDALVTHLHAANAE
jgi:hypothetical protein